MNPVLKNLRAGKATDEDYEFVEGLIRSGACEDLHRYLGAYIEFAPNLMAEELIQLALETNDQYFVSEVVNNLAYRYYSSDAYKNLVWHGLFWPFQDPGHDVLSATLSRLPRYFPASAEIKAVLLGHLASDDPIIRDVVAEVAQEYLGVPSNEVCRTMGEGDLLDQLDPSVRRWLESSSEETPRRA